MLTALYLILVFIFGVIVGYWIKSWMVNRFDDYIGTIFVGRDPERERTVYTLELDSQPEELEQKKRVAFKIDTSNRE